MNESRTALLSGIPRNYLPNIFNRSFNDIPIGRYFIHSCDSRGMPPIFYISDRAKPLFWFRSKPKPKPNGFWETETETETEANTQYIAIFRFLDHRYLDHFFLDNLGSEQ